MPTDYEALNWMMNMCDNHGWTVRWRLSLIKLYFTDKYSTGIKKEVLNALSSCTPYESEEVGTEDGIHSYEPEALVMTQEKVENCENEEYEKILDEKVDLYDV